MFSPGLLTLHLIKLMTFSVDTYFWATLYVLHDAQRPSRMCDTHATHLTGHDTVIDDGVYTAAQNTDQSVL